MAKLAKPKKTGKRGRPAKAKSIQAIKKVTKSTKAVKSKKTVQKKASKQTKSKASANPILAIESAFKQAINNSTKELSSMVATISKDFEKLKKQLDKLVVKQKSAKTKKQTMTEKVAQKKTQGAINQLARAKEAYREITTELKILKDETATVKAQLKEAKFSEAKFISLIKLINKADKGLPETAAKVSKTKAKAKAKKTVSTKRKRKAATAKEQEAVIVIEASSPEYVVDDFTEEGYEMIPDSERETSNA